MLINFNIDYLLYDMGVSFECTLLNLTIFNRGTSIIIAIKHAICYAVY